MQLQFSPIHQRPASSAGPRSGSRLRAAVPDAAAARDSLPEEAQQCWRECSARVQALGVDADKVDALVARAFGFGSQAYWRNELASEAPSLAAVDAALEFLEGLGIGAPADQAALIVKFPEVLRVDRELMGGNVAKLQTSFFMKGPALAKAVQRKPRVLGATTDCAGDCAGDCTRCFAQF